MEYKNSQYHLSNNREVWFANANSTIQRTQYYPGGLPWAEGTGANEQNRKYNGKEFIEMHGYDTYDYGARGYYSTIMRFTTVDPMAEKAPNWTPYNYTFNNPINLIDPDGQFPVVPPQWFISATSWIQEKSNALRNLITGTSGNINAPTRMIPESTQRISKVIGTAQDATTVAEGVVDVAEGAMEGVNTIPGFDVVGDPLLAGYYGGIKGDKESGVSYALAATMPGASGLFFSKGAKELKHVMTPKTTNSLRKMLGLGKKDNVHDVKNIILGDHKEIMRSNKSFRTNPDIGIDTKTGNVTLKSRKTGDIILTDTPMEIYKKDFNY